MNWVLSARVHPLLSRHASARDVVAVVLAAPFVTWAAHRVLAECAGTLPLPTAVTTVLCALALALHVPLLPRYAGVEWGMASLTTDTVMLQSSKRVRLEAGAKLLLGALLVGWAHVMAMWRGEWLPVLAWDAAFWTLVLLTALSLRSFYLHLHHWFVGLALLPLAATGWPALSCTLFGLAWGTFLEGAARWSCAPLLHKRHSDLFEMQ